MGSQWQIHDITFQMHLRHVLLLVVGRHYCPPEVSDYFGNSPTGMCSVLGSGLVIDIAIQRIFCGWLMRIKVNQTTWNGVVVDSESGPSCEQYGGSYRGRD